LLTDDWYTTVIGIASDQGPGDDNEMDYQHIRNQQTQLLAYNYTWNPELFDGSQGGNDASGNPTPSQVSTAVNEGSSLILYTGHGSTTSWGTSGFNNNNVNSLTNQNKLPFIWSVACVNGEFMSTTCFAEAWLRATQNNQPTGAVAFLGSTINQSWNSPMEGQDEMTDVLAESYPGNIKRTFAGLSISGCMQMIDTYGSDGQNMADTWTVFGDPTLMVRTDNPELMTVTHLPTVFVGATSLLVNCNVNGARATASIADTILATGIVANGSVTLTFPALPNPADTLHLVVTAYNKIPYEADLQIITPNGPYILYFSNHVNDTTGNNDHAVDYSEDILLTISLKNIGVAPTSGLNVSLRTEDPFITLTDSTEAYGAINAGEQKSVWNAFAFETANNIPDGHVIPFDVYSVDGAQTWTSNFTLTAHAPTLAMVSYDVIDTTGNNNGKLDPGETVYLKISVSNSGSAGAYDVFGNLTAINPWITVTSGMAALGNMQPGQQVVHYYMVTVDAAAPEGSLAPFIFDLTAQHGISVSSVFDLFIGKIPALIVDYDVNSNSGPAMKSAIEALDLPVTYATSLPDTIDQYSAIFICLGVFPDNFVLPSNTGQRLATYLDNGGRLYMEGGETWYSDPKTPVHAKFFILGYNDGGSDLGSIAGQSGTFTNGMNFFYGGDNTYIDRITYDVTSFNIFKNQSPSYYTAVANDAGIYRTIGSSFEFGGLIEGTFPSTKNNLMAEYLGFFGIQPPPLMANFAGHPTSIVEGNTVEFLDFSTGGVNNWTWSFPGGTPATSTEANPVVLYTTPGTYDVQLIVGNGTSYDTLDKADYINVDLATGTRENIANLSCVVRPNPGNGNFILNLSSERGDVVKLTVYSVTGTIVYQESGIGVTGSMTHALNLTRLPQGIYYLNIEGERGNLVRKLVIQK
jgi:PKD repeat protein